MNPTTPATAGERTVPMTDFMTLRAEWKAAGCPEDHPYWDWQLPEPTPVEPLAISLTTGQREFMERYAPVAEAQSRANIEALWDR